MEFNNYNNGYQPQNQDFQNNQPQQNEYANSNQYAQPQQNEYANPNQYAQPQQNEYANPNQYTQPHQNEYANSNQYAQPQQNEYANPNQYAQPQQNNGYNYNVPQQYNQPYYNQQYPNYNLKPTQPKGLAITSFVMGISSMLISCCMWYITLFVSIAGLVLGIVSIKKNEGARGLAIAGIILSCVGIVFSLVMAILFVVEISATPRYLY